MEQVKEEEKFEECVICMEANDQVHIMCPANHGYCSNDLNLLYEDLIINSKPITNKCTLCSQEMFTDKLKVLLADDVQFAMKNTNPLEVFQVPDFLCLIKCPCCPVKFKASQFLVDKNDYAQYYQCNAEACKKLVCLYCRQECKNKNDHWNCNEYRREAEDLEKVIEYSIFSFCHKCNDRLIDHNGLVPSMKDGCTHMSCNKCNSHYCYVCGGHEDNVDKANNVNVNNQAPIFKHNVDFKINEKRCPLYLHEFSSMVSGFPTNEHEATLKFRDYKTNAYMKILIVKYGRQRLKSAYEHFKKKRLFHLPDSYLTQDYSKIKSYPVLDKKFMQYFKIN